MRLAKLNRVLMLGMVLGAACSNGLPYVGGDGGAGRSMPGSGGSTLTTGSGGAAAVTGGSGGTVIGGGGHAAPGGNGGGMSSGGVTGTGASAATGGRTAGGGGASASGGTGGQAGAGMAGGSGAVVGSGGHASGASGGIVGTGGRASGSGGTVVSGSGGITASGGAPSSSGGVVGTGGVLATGGTLGTGGMTVTRPTGPCDIYGTAGTPCVAAYSTVRALSKAYAGPLYQVRNMSSTTNTGSGGTTRDIGMTADGFADSASQDAFCLQTTCTFSVLYDQSGSKNDLRVAPAGSTGGGANAALPDYEASATAGSLTVGGHAVYALYTTTREGYRFNGRGANMPLMDGAQGIYMLADGTHSGMGCCFDFGNVSVDPTAYKPETALFLGTAFWGMGAGTGPWFMGDFQGGVWAGGSGSALTANPNNPSLKVSFAFGTLKTSSGQYVLRMADVKTATSLATAYDGASPTAWNNDGGIVLGVESDNSNGSYGTFYEGAIVSGLPADATDLAVMQNVQAAGY